MLQPPSYCESDECYTPQQDRLLWRSVICQEGPKALADLVVTAGTGMNVDISPGAAFIQGDSVADEGMYWVQSTATETRAIAPADLADPRIDIVVARVTSDCTWAIQVITGTPSPTPVAPSVPPSAVWLGQVAVPAAATSVTVSSPIVAPAQVCPELLPRIPGWRTIAQGSQGGGTLSSVIPIPTGPGFATHIRGTLSYQLNGAGDVGIRVNGLTGANYQSGYRSWITNGTLSQTRGALTDTWCHLGYSGDGLSGIMTFEIAAATNHEAQMTARFSYLGATLPDMRSGIGEGRYNANLGTVTSIQVVTAAAAFTDLNWTVEASYDL